MALITRKDYKEITGYGAPNGYEEFNSNHDNRLSINNKRLAHEVVMGLHYRRVIVIQLSIEGDNSTIDAEPRHETIEMGAQYSIGYWEGSQHVSLGIYDVYSSRQAVDNEGTYIVTELREARGE